MKNLADIFNFIKKDFCDLLSFKFRGNTLEIITGVPTITSAAISVFVSYSHGKFAISDGGWLAQGEYNQYGEDPEETEITSRIIEQYRDYFNIKTVTHANGALYYYRTTDDIKLLSAAVHDLSHFVANAVNTSYISIRNATDETEQKHLFHNTINNYFKSIYGSQNVGVNFKVKLRDDQSVRVNASLQVKNNGRVLQYYIMYVTGQRNDLFIKDASKAALNFKIIKDYAVEGSFFQRIAIINKKADGYDKQKVGLYLEQLEGVTEQDATIDVDSNIEDLFKRMPLN